MRERFAMGVSLLAVVTLIGLAVWFARAQNPSIPVADVALPDAVDTPALPEGAPSAPAADSVRGHAVYLARGCAGCHSVAGEGNPRNPLDGVGARRTAAELRDWTVGAEVLADSLPPSAFRAKQAFQRIEPEDLAALIQYLVSLELGR
jgi:mono/diheme cytochrome c family protein